MNKQEFMNELRNKIKKLPKEEIDNAISYYEEYFEEAGVENEQNVIKELGSPSIVGSELIANFAVKEIENIKESNSKSRLSAIWLAVIAIFVSPIALPVAIAMAAVIFSLLVVIFSVIFAFAVTGITLFLSGVITLIAAIMIVFQDVATSIFFIGAACLLVGLSVLFIVFTKFISQKCFVFIVNGVSKMLKRGENKNEK